MVVLWFGAIELVLVSSGSGRCSGEAVLGGGGLGVLVEVYVGALVQRGWG